MNDVREKAEHTPEPWKVRHAPEGMEGCFIEGPRPEGMAYSPEIMGDDYTGFGGGERRLADAERIVACVNTLVGVDDPAAFVDRSRALEALCGELLGACDALRNRLEITGWPVAADSQVGELDIVVAKAKALVPTLTTSKE